MRISINENFKAKPTIKDQTVTFSIFNFRFSLLIFFTFHFSFFAVQAQRPNLDSLNTIGLDETQPDTVRFEAMAAIAGGWYLSSNPDSAFILAQRLKDLAQEKGNKKWQATATTIQGISFKRTGKYDEALDYFHQSLRLNEEINAKTGMANSLQNIGVIYKIQGKLKGALEYFQRSLKVNEEIGNDRGIAGCLNNLGYIYKRQGRTNEALEYYQRCLKIREEHKDKRGVAVSLNGITGIYLEQGKNNEASEYLQRALKMFEEIGDKNGVAGTLGNLGKVYLKLGESDKALEFEYRSLKMKEELGDKRGTATSLNSVGSILKDQGKIIEALGYLKRSLEISQEIGDVDGIQSHSKSLYMLYEHEGDGMKALEMHKLYVQMRDSIQSEEVTKKLAQMGFEKKMLTDSIANVDEARLVQKAHEEEMREKENTRNWSMASAGFALLLAGGFYVRWRYVNSAKKIIEKEKDRSDNLLLNILPAEVAEELKDKGESEAQHFEQVSILFTDFKAFTEAAEKLTAKELVKEINTYFKAFDEICVKYGIEKIKTIGDAYMAAAGLKGQGSESKVSSLESAQNLVAAALEMQHFVTTRNPEPETNKFEMRAGIHTGPVVAGIVGVKKFQYDIWGDTVNTAARMESHGEVGKVNVSQTTYELLKDTSASLSIQNQFSFESRGKIEAKGKGEMEMFFVEPNDE